MNKELNTSMDLEKNGLDDLDTESENDDHVNEPTPKPEGPLEAAESCSVKVNGIELNINSCVIRADELASILMQMFEQLNKPHTKDSSYVR